MILSFGSVLVSILAFVFALGLIILIHEGGHFFFARKAKILCREYAFGMGPQLLKKKVGETTYSLRAFPIGGFCAIAGEETEADPLKGLAEVKLLIENGVVTKIIFDDTENIYEDAQIYKLVNYDLFDKDDTGHLYITVKGETEEDEDIELPVDPQAMYVQVKKIRNKELSNEKKRKRYAEEIQIAPHNRTLNAKSKTARALVMFGGPLMNFVLAVLVFFLAGLIGGFANTKSTKLDKIDEGTPAFNKLLEDDKILELSAVDSDGNIITSGELTKWDGISKFMDTYKTNPKVDGEITVKFDRNGEIMTTSIDPVVIIYSVSMLEDLNDKDNVRIAELAKQSKAYEGGLRTGDIIKKIRYASEDKTSDIEITSWKQVYSLFTANTKGDPMVLTVLRGDETVECTIDPFSEKLFKKTQNVDITSILIGVSPQTKFNFGKSFVYSFTEVGHSFKNMFNTLGMLFGSKEVGIGDLSGPIGIFSMTSNAAKAGFASLLNWIGFLSVNIGFLNLLPIPALDGGRLVFVAYEAITKKKPSEKVETALITITMILLFGLIIFVSFNDILRLLGVK